MFHHPFMLPLQPLTQPCTMFRQFLRPSIRPVSRSGLPRAQHAARTCHTHSFKPPPPRPPHKCSRLHIPIQTSTVFLQIGQPCSCPRRPHHPFYNSSQSFHTTQRVEATPLIGVLAALKVRAPIVMTLAAAPVDRFSPSPALP